MYGEFIAQKQAAASNLLGRAGICSKLLVLVEDTVSQREGSTLRLLNQFHTKTSHLP